MNELEQRLALAISDILSVDNSQAEATAFQIDGLLRSIEDGSPGEQPHVLFHALCVLAEDAFPDSAPSDTEILANPATPALMRYFLASLRRYRARCKDARLTSSQRCNAIANALKMTGEKKNPGKWTNAMKEEYCSSFSAARDKALESGKTKDDAHQIGIEAAYLVYRRGEKDVQDTADYQKAIKKIAAFLEEQGYGNSQG